ncbi:hypothetical protein GTZ97_00485 [Aquabacterium fontiphilum]|uniref:hypothetical protein n=1 Tax=Aquabacterium fontiphilum TaxID=450365 RepID=UPI001378E433|nr:hypothetical protein [Aquabacterium fontiphilum]NBD19146.1 hypothetical protein [Aquabacterium fontiphilum]
MTTTPFRARRAAATFARTMGAAALLASAGLSHAQLAPHDTVMFAHASLTNLQVTLIDLTPDDGVAPSATFLAQRYALSTHYGSNPFAMRQTTLVWPEVDLLSDPERAASGLSAKAELNATTAASLVQDWQASPPMGYFGLAGETQTYRTEVTPEPVASVLLGSGTGIVLRGTWSMWGSTDLDALLTPVASLDEDTRDPTLMTEVYAGFSPIGFRPGLTGLHGIASGEGTGTESNFGFSNTGTFEIGFGNLGDEEAAVALTLLAKASVMANFSGLRIPTIPDIQPPVAIPEPASAALMLVGLVGLLALRGRMGATPRFSRIDIHPPTPQHG